MSNSSKRNLGVRLPVDWIDQLTDIGHRSGRTLSQVATEAIGVYLGEEVPKIHSMMAEIIERIEAIEAQRPNRRW
jgi:predicted DNA-binding protein